MTDVTLPDGASGQHGRSLTRTTSEVVAIVLIVGVPWFLLAEQDGEWWLPLETLAFLTAGLAVIFGASMSAVRGFTASAALAAAVIGGTVLGADVGGPDFYALNVVEVYLVAFGTLILVPLAWLVGFVIGSLWRRVARR
jgi:hypothetical protein